MSLTDVSKLTLHEKFQVMESIWADLRNHLDSADVPESHKALLDSRRKRVSSGQVKILDWDSVKHSIGKR